MYESSSFRMVSYGIVAENKKRDTDVVEIYPVEMLGELRDEIMSELDLIEKTGSTFDGRPYLVRLKRGITWPATWLGADLRYTSPDVRRGEVVFLWQSGDADKYFWSVIGRKWSNKLRRLETVVFAISAHPHNDDSDFDRNNCYVLEMSSHDKHISLTTSDKNGEKATYAFQFNTATGEFFLNDNHGNEAWLDSTERRWRFKNGDDSYIDMNKTILDIFTKDQINFRTTDFTIEASNSITNATNTYTETSKTYTHNGGSINLNSSDFNNVSGFHTISGLQQHDAMVAFPSFTVGPGATPSASSGGEFVGSLDGGLEQTSGKLKLLEIESDNGNFGSITWGSASGPLPG